MTSVYWLVDRVQILTIHNASLVHSVCCVIAVIARIAGSLTRPRRANSGGRGGAFAHLLQQLLECRLCGAIAGRHSQFKIPNACQ